MKVGIVTEWFERGSAYVSLEIQHQLQKQGIYCEIYARSEAFHLNQEIWPGENVTVGKPSLLPFGKAIDRRDFESWLKSARITHVIFNEQIWIAPVFWAKDLGIKTIGYVDYYKKNTIKHFKVYDALICNTKRHYSVFSWHENCWYIPWGTNLRRFQPRGHNERDYLTFIHSGGWSPYRKGTDLVVDAFSKIEDANVRLIVHVQISKSDLFVELPNTESLINRDKRITLLTKPMQAEELYSMGEVYVYPSRLEGIGLTQAEALASGLPIIVPDDGPMSEFVLESISKLTSVRDSWYRSDSYYWPMNQVDIEALTNNMIWFINNFKTQPNWVKVTRSAAERFLDAEKNMSSLGTLLTSLRPNAHRYLMLRFITFSTRILVRISPQLFRAKQLIRKFGFK